MNKAEWEASRIRDMDRAVGRVRGILYTLKETVRMAYIQLGDLSVDLEADFLEPDCLALENMEKQIEEMEKRLSNAHK